MSRSNLLLNKTNCKIRRFFAENYKINQLAIYAMHPLR